MKIKIILFMLSFNLLSYGKYEKMYGMREPQKVEEGFIYTSLSHSKNKFISVRSKEGQNGLKLYNSIIAKIEKEAPEGKVKILDHFNEFESETLTIKTPNGYFYIRNYNNKKILTIEISEEIESSLFEGYLNYLNVNHITNALDKLKLNEIKYKL